MEAPELQPADMAELFDFPGASMPDEMNGIVPELSLEEQDKSCLVHPDEDCICNDLDNISVTAVGLEEEKEFNNDFSSWIPRYSKPAAPCDYCGPRKLDCFFTCYSDSAPAQSCTSCSALFRPCSFAKPEESVRPHNAIDTLHVVGEDDCVQSGDLTGYKPLRSKYLGRLNRGSTPSLDEPERGRKSGTRFSRAALKILKEWMEEHRSNPYPSEEEKEMLTKRTNLSISQVNNWLANTRRREKNKMPKRATSPSIRPSTEAVDVPEGRTWYDLNPFERWKHSPPENEPAPMPIILDNIRQFSPPTGSSSASSYRQQKSSTSGSHYSALRAPSTTSLETGSKLSASAFSSQSVDSFDSAKWSHCSRRSWGSFGSFGDPNKDRRRRRRATAKPQKPSIVQSKIFQCTFCTDRFKSKYDWSRHEKSLHLSLEKWICAPLGHTVTSMTGEKKCACCDEANPSPDHIESHNYQACAEKGIEARTFYRKDHLRQHLKLMHGCKMTDSMEAWKSEASLVNCRCGFCGQSFDRWQDRVDHLAKEFKNGALMKDWKGCRGLDPHIASLVTNAMPPYLIDNESKSPIPFSASNTASMNQHAHLVNAPDLEVIIPTYTTSALGPNPTFALAGPTTQANCLPHSNTCLASTLPATYDLGSNTTCWEYLTIHLGQFAQEKMAQGIVPTDAMIQHKARVILYDDDDMWNQTAADNPEWLSLFKKAHNIVDVPADFDRRDALEDLGMIGLTNIEGFDPRQGPPDVAHWKAKSMEQSASPLITFDGGYQNLGDFYSTVGEHPPALTTSVSPRDFQLDLLHHADANGALGYGTTAGIAQTISKGQSPSTPALTSAALASEHEAFQLDEDLFADMTFDEEDYNMGGIASGFSMSLPNTTDVGFKF